MITSFATALTKELGAYTPVKLENGIKEKRKIDRRLLFLIEKILLKTSTVFSDDQQESLVKALRYSAEKHKGKYRKDKVTPYFHHPLEVALIPIELGVNDYTATIAALLHDIVEDTETTPKEIAFHFGERIRNVVEILSRFKKDEIRNKKYWNIMKQEPDLGCKWRVLILKFADRIHYFMTSDIIPEESKKKKVEETFKEFPELYRVLRETHAKLSPSRVVKDRRQYDNIPKKLYTRLMLEIARHP